MSQKTLDELNRARDEALGIIPINEVAIDCYPGSPRPNEYIEGVVKETPLENHLKKDECGKVFGAWFWRFDEVSGEDFAAAKPIMRESLEALYSKRISGLSGRRRGNRQRNRRSLACPGYSGK